MFVHPCMHTFIHSFIHLADENFKLFFNSFYKRFLSLLPSYKRKDLLNCSIRTPSPHKLIKFVMQPKPKKSTGIISHTLSIHYPFVCAPTHKLQWRKFAEVVLDHYSSLLSLSLRPISLSLVHSLTPKNASSRQRRFVNGQL